MYHLPEFSLHATDHCNYNCRHCLHFAPFRVRREYAPHEYFPAIDRLSELGYLDNPKITITGGETFLHSDLLNFVREFKTRYPTFRFALVTNAFWLNSKKDIDKYKDMWGLLHGLYLSEYKPINQDLVDQLRELVTINHNKRHSFYRANIVDHQELSVIPYGLRRDGYCMYIDCPQLLADGRLMKCVLGYASLSLYPVPQNFRNCSEMFFDVFGSGDLEKWRLRYPFDACYYCRMDGPVPHSFGDSFRVL